jgi:hypothetical protein
MYGHFPSVVSWDEWFKFDMILMEPVHQAVRWMCAGRIRHFDRQWLDCPHTVISPR